jgi:hypothetical protein
MISKASAVVLTTVPFGYGNLRNLEAAKEALKKGIRTFVLEEVPIEQRDFTKGKAKKHLKELKGKGAIFVKNQNELLSLLDVSKDKVKTRKELSTKILGHLKPETNSNEGDEVVVSKPNDN